MDETTTTTEEITETPDELLLKASADLLRVSADLFQTIGSSTGANRAVHASCTFGGLQIQLFLTGKINTPEGQSVLNAAKQLVANAEAEASVYDASWENLKAMINQAFGDSEGKSE